LRVCVQTLDNPPVDRLGWVCMQTLKLEKVSERVWEDERRRRLVGELAIG